MSLSSDDLLKKLKPTKTFAVTGSEIRALAKLAAELGPDGFVGRWESATKRQKQKSPRAPDELAAIKAKTTQFGAKRKLSSAQTAQAIYNHLHSAKKIQARPTKSALKSTASMVGWLAKRISAQTLQESLNGFFTKYESATDLTHRLPRPVDHSG